MQETTGSYPLRWIGGATAALVLVAIVLLALNVRSVANAVDGRVLEREITALDQGLYLLGEIGASEQLALTRWDEAFEMVVVAPSPSWMRGNLGRSAYPDTQDHRLVIVGGDRRVLFASDADGAPEAAAGAAIVEAVQPLIDQLASRYRAALADEDILDERREGALNEGLYGHDVAIVDGVPSLVVASPFLPDIGDHSLPARPTLLLDIRAMTPTLLGHLGRTAHLEGVRLAGEAGADGGAPLRVLRSQAGSTVAMLTWDHRPPGAAVLRSALPAIGLSVVFLAIVSGALAGTVRRTARALAQSERAALHSARHDGATGLVNRAWFLEELRRVAARPGPGPAAVALIDCDYFKAINDTLGHAAGDAVLVAIAGRLRAFGGESGIAARFGGDEFALVLRDLPDPAALPRMMTNLARDLMQPVVFEGQSIPVGVSIGAVLFTPGEGAPEETLLPLADLALYRAKRDGRGRWRIYDPAIDRPQGEPVAAELLKRARRDLAA